jgi:hypothetical protein
MGTRAMILFEGKPMLATHWDGDPSSLGKSLLKAKSKTPLGIFKASGQYSIDWANPKFAPSKPIITGGGLEQRGKKWIRLKKTTYFARSDAETNRLITEKIGKDAGTANSSGTIKITDAYGNYGDFAEYAYNIRADGTVEVAELSGEWTGKVPKRFTPVKDYLAKKKLGEVS